MQQVEHKDSENWLVGVKFFPGVLYFPLSGVTLEHAEFHCTLHKQSVKLTEETILSLFSVSHDYLLVRSGNIIAAQPLQGILKEIATSVDSSYLLRFTLS